MDMPRLRSSIKQQVLSTVTPRVKKRHYSQVCLFLIFYKVYVISPCRNRQTMVLIFSLLFTRSLLAY